LEQTGQFAWPEPRGTSQVRGKSLRLQKMAERLRIWRAGFGLAEGQSDGLPGSPETPDKSKEPHSEHNPGEHSPPGSERGPSERQRRSNFRSLRHRFEMAGQGQRPSPTL